MGKVCRTLDPDGRQAVETDDEDETPSVDPQEAEYEMLRQANARRFAIAGDLASDAGEVVEEGYWAALAGGGKKIWSATKKTASVLNAFRHWKKHGSEFPEMNNAKEYVEASRRFLTNPPRGALRNLRKNGDLAVYDPATNTYVVLAAGGVPRTMFRPQSGMAYWAADVSKGL